MFPGNRLIECGSDGLASSWQIAPGVTIDPRIGFGSPCASGTGVSAYILAAQYRANKCNAALVARLFAIKLVDVMNAVEFEKRLLAE